MGPLSGIKKLGTHWRVVAGGDNWSGSNTAKLLNLRYSKVPESHSKRQIEFPVEMSSRMNERLLTRINYIKED